ncbi:TPA: hypothetical protein N0F65_007910 [Lagenidium giganteum]|uniref:Endothelin-converting enzyme 1 n=1 Tax=Lagenidium giganteum TaxID=4803 RepID=A0AAV2YZ20_9STRA|nr:TPA: hypothetical protein N0F65_007910 [Lagenidium giganteum]
MKVYATTASIFAASLCAAAVHAEFPAKVTEMLDTTVDPCDDFEQYACGKWLKSYTLPDSKVTSDALDDLAERNQALLQKMLESSSDPILGGMYRSCMDVDKLNKIGAAPLKANLDLINGVQSKVELFHLVGKLARATSTTVFTILDVSVDSKKTTEHIVDFVTKDLTLPERAFYQDAEMWQNISPALTKYVAQALSLAGMNGTEKIVVEMENEIAELMPSNEDRLDPLKSYNPISLSDAQTRFPVTAGEVLSGFGLTEKLTKDSTVTFGSLEFAEKVEQWVAKKDLKHLQAFIAYSYVNQVSEYLGEPMMSARFALFDQAVGGSKQAPPRGETCMNMLMTKLQEPLGQEYAKAKFDQDGQKMAEMMVKLIHEAMKTNIATADWLDDETKKNAQTKLTKVSDLIGKPTYTVDYSSANIKPDALMANFEGITSVINQRKINKIGAKVDPSTWTLSAIQANAMYVAQENKMVYPAGALQPPFMDSKAHPAQSFGAIGIMMGHELTHGFDSIGRRYDHEGMLNVWWSNETNAQFLERARCLEQQYSRFPMIGEDGKTELGKVNGALTLSENIADNGGAKLAWEAYNAYMKNSTNAQHTQNTHNIHSNRSACTESPQAVTESPHGATQQLTAEEAAKLFFISFGQSFCSKARDERVKFVLSSDNHSPARWRINGVMMNSRTFAKTFQCAAGTKMNPEKKCEVW